MKQLVISTPPKDYYIFQRRSKYMFFISAPPKNVNYYTFSCTFSGFKAKPNTHFVSYTQISASGHTGQEVQMKQLVISATQPHQKTTINSKYMFSISAPPKKLNITHISCALFGFNAKPNTCFVSYTRILASGHTGQEVQMKQLVILAPYQKTTISSRGG